MALFGRRKDAAATASRQPRPSTSATPSAYASAASLPAPTTDWTDLTHVRAEWSNGNLEAREQALLSWQNGTRMFHEGVIPQQRMNAAQYIAQGLAYHLYEPILSDADALTAAQQILLLVDRIPPEPEWMAKFGPRLSRLALAVIRERGWQPSALGGDDSIVDEIVNARPDGLVLYSARGPGVAPEDVWRHFFRH